MLFSWGPRTIKFIFAYKQSYFVMNIYGGLQRKVSYYLSTSHFLFRSVPWSTFYFCLTTFDFLFPTSLSSLSRFMFTCERSRALHFDLQLKSTEKRWRGGDLSVNLGTTQAVVRHIHAWLCALPVHGCCLYGSVSLMPIPHPLERPPVHCHLSPCLFCNQKALTGRPSLKHVT